MRLAPSASSSQVDARHPPNKRSAHHRSARALPAGQASGRRRISTSRRSAAPPSSPARLYARSFAQADANSWTVEFTAPADPYERLHLKQDTPVKLRGWYLARHRHRQRQGRQDPRARHHERRRRPARRGDRRSARHALPYPPERRDRAQRLSQQDLGLGRPAYLAQDRRCALPRRFRRADLRPPRRRPVDWRGRHQHPAAGPRPARDRRQPALRRGHARA